MKKRSFDEMIAYFNRRVSEMDIDQDYKMELLGMVTAIGHKHEQTAQPRKGKWVPGKEVAVVHLGNNSVPIYGNWHCSECGLEAEQWELYNFCHNCGAKMENSNV